MSLLNYKSSLTRLNSSFKTSLKSMFDRSYIHMIPSSHFPSFEIVIHNEKDFHVLQMSKSTPINYDPKKWQTFICTNLQTGTNICMSTQKEIKSNLIKHPKRTTNKKKYLDLESEASDCTVFSTSSTVESPGGS